MKTNDNQQQIVSGFINLFKPTGGSSFNCIRFLRKILNTKKIGHMGTLDPLAEGVLPVAVGNATRLIEYVTSYKTYISEFQLGVTTNTDDIEGEVIRRVDVNPFPEKEIQNYLQDFEGDISQVPPAVSAVHVNGERAYKLARTGREPELSPRPVKIYSIKLLNYNHPFITLEISTGPGTYIRSIARDLGEKLNCGAIVSKLRRTRSGPFFIDNSITMEKLEEFVNSGKWDEILVNTVNVLELPIVYVRKSGEDRIKHGMTISMEDIEKINLKSITTDKNEEQKFLVVNLSADVLAVSRQEKPGTFAPEKVLAV
jgi:tRNA pseudouridine55 synthase